MASYFRTTFVKFDLFVYTWILAHTGLNICILHQVNCEFRDLLVYLHNFLSFEVDNMHDRCRLQDIWPDLTKISAKTLCIIYPLIYLKLNKLYPGDHFKSTKFKGSPWISKQAYSMDWHTQIFLNFNFFFWLWHHAKSVFK